MNEVNICLISLFCHTNMIRARSCARVKISYSYFYLELVKNQFCHCYMIITKYEIIKKKNETDEFIEYIIY